MKMFSIPILAKPVENRLAIFKNKAYMLMYTIYII